MSDTGSGAVHGAVHGAVNGAVNGTVHRAVNGAIHGSVHGIDRRYALAALLLILIGSLRIVSTYTVLSHTMDEPVHLGVGMEWLDRGTFAGDLSHPPLARVLSAVGPYLTGERSGGGPDSMQEGLRILGHDRHYDRILALARAGILPFFWIAAWVVFLWGYRASGPNAALIAVFLFTTLPPVLAHAGQVTTDMAATAMLGAGMYAALLWAERPDRRRTVILGLAAGLGLIAKFSLVVYLPAVWFLMVAWRVARTRTLRGAWKEIYRRRGSIAAVAGIAFLVIWAGYRFTFGPVEFLPFPAPAPGFLKGVHLVWEHNQAGHASYIWGERHMHGVWYFFPVLLAIKTPLAMLVLLPWALWAAWRKQLNAAMPVAYSLGILLIAMSSRINIGVRHVLPIYVGLCVLCGIGGAWILRRRAGQWTAGKFALLALLGWSAISGALQHPDYLPYTNELAGNHPEAFVADSDLDWGQDMKRVGAFLKKVNATEVTFVPYSITYLQAGYPFPRVLPGEWAHPSPGWNAVSLGGWKLYNHPGWVDGRQPQVRIGRTHWLWYFPPVPSSH